MSEIVESVVALFADGISLLTIIEIQGYANFPLKAMNIIIKIPQ